MNTADLVSLAGAAYMVLPFIWDWRWAAAVWLTTFLTEFIKWATRDMAFACLKRPTGATACDALARGGSVSGAPGFPSGHAAASAAFWMGAWLLAPAEWRPTILAMGTAATVGMGWARMTKKCHTGLQVIAGTLLGMLVSVILVR